MTLAAKSRRNAGALRGEPSPIENGAQSGHNRLLSRYRAEAMSAPTGTRLRAIDGIPELLAEAGDLRFELSAIAGSLQRVLGSQSLAIYVSEHPSCREDGLAPIASVGDAGGGRWRDSRLVRSALDQWRSESVRSFESVTQDGITVLPISYHAECVGALAIEHGAQGLPEDARLRDVGNLLGLAALTIANHALRADGARRLAEMRALREVGRAVSFGLSTETVLADIFSVGAEILSYDTASLFVVDEAEGLLRLIASRNIPPEVARQCQFRKGEGVVGWVVDQERPAAVPDTRTDERFRVIGAQRRRAHSLLVVPLRMRGKVIAALSFARHRLNAFTSDDLELAEAIAAHAAQALEHSRLSKTAAEAESLRQGAELLASISHDIRTPLSLIRVVVDLLRRDFPSLDDQQAALLNEITDASNQLGKMINLALESSRLETSLQTLRREWINLAELGQSVILGLSWRASAKHQLLSEVPGWLGAYVDPTQFHRVISNLVDNAIKYSPDGGRVVIRAWRGERGVSVSVSDEGVGIDPKHISRLFERFYRAGNRLAVGESFGLGLHTCKRIVEAHAGVITVESRPGQGTTFVVSLPDAL